MASYRQILYHLTFHTKNSEKVLFKYIWGVLKNRNCKLFRINGIEDHIHIVCDLHPSIALADLVKDIKVASSKWIKEKNIYPKFSNWAESYGAFTLSVKEKDSVIKYVMNQQEHHRKESSRDEFISFLKENDVEYDEYICSNFIRPVPGWLFSTLPLPPLAPGVNNSKLLRSKKN